MGRSSRGERPGRQQTSKGGGFALWAAAEPCWRVRSLLRQLQTAGSSRWTGRRCDGGRPRARGSSRGRALGARRFVWAAQCKRLHIILLVGARASAGGRRRRISGALARYLSGISLRCTALHTVYQRTFVAFGLNGHCAEGRLRRIKMLPIPSQKHSWSSG